MTINDQPDYNAHVCTNAIPRAYPEHMCQICRSPWYGQKTVPEVLGQNYELVTSMELAQELLKQAGMQEASRLMARIQYHLLELEAAYAGEAEHHRQTEKALADVMLAKVADPSFGSIVSSVQAEVRARDTDWDALRADRGG